MLQVVSQQAMAHPRWRRIGQEASTSLEVQSQPSTAQCHVLGFQAERTLLEETLTRRGHAQAPPVVILMKCSTRAIVTIVYGPCLHDALHLSSVS